MRTPSSNPRILLALFVIIAWAILAGLFFYLTGGMYRQQWPINDTHEELHKLSGISFALGALAGSGAGALWSLLMNRLPPTTSGGQILLRGIGLGAVANPAATLLGHLGLAIIYQRFEFYDILAVILLLGIPVGLATGLACSLLAWGVSAWERRGLLAQYKPPNDDAYLRSRGRHPRIFPTVLVILSSALCSAVIYGYIAQWR